MARPKRKKKERAERLHREPIVREVARILETGTPTKFRYESACRHGLRASFCMDGLKWDAADERARQIVTLALHRIGASLRPTWSIGQPQRDATREYFYCRHCQAFMPEGNSSPWCGEQCREARWIIEWKRGSAADDVARREALRSVFGASAEPSSGRAERKCKGCDKAFVPNQRGQRFCSNPCARHHVKSTWLRESKPCAICSTPFMAHLETSLYCSAPCVAEGERRVRRAWMAKKRAQHDKTCAICSKAFLTSRLDRIYCGDECAAEGVRRKNRAYKKARRELRPSREQVKCMHCHEFFEPGASGNIGRFCGGLCRGRAWREQRRAVGALAQMAEAASGQAADIPRSNSLAKGDSILHGLNCSAIER